MKNLKKIEIFLRADREVLKRKGSKNGNFQKRKNFERAFLKHLETFPKKKFFYRNSIKGNFLFGSPNVLKTLFRNFSFFGNFHFWNLSFLKPPDQPSKKISKNFKFFMSHHK